jgi:hypothetical protein
MRCPTCGQEVEDDGGNHLVHDQMCEKTLCKVCDHCEFSSGAIAETCRCRECSCIDINYPGIIKGTL